MRQAAKVDANQAKVVAALRAIGASVQPLHQIGKGCPDLLVCHYGKLFLLEVKDGAKPPSDRRLTDDQKNWIAKWPGPVYVVTSEEEAIMAVSG